MFYVKNSLKYKKIKVLFMSKLINYYQKFVLIWAMKGIGQLWKGDNSKIIYTVTKRHSIFNYLIVCNNYFDIGLN
jgi:hypothetical protein